MSPSKAVTYSGTSITPELGENKAFLKTNPGLFSITCSLSVSHSSTLFFFPWRSKTFNFCSSESFEAMMNLPYFL